MNLLIAILLTLGGISLLSCLAGIIMLVGNKFLNENQRDKIANIFAFVMLVGCAVALVKLVYNDVCKYTRPQESPPGASKVASPENLPKPH